MSEFKKVTALLFFASSLLQFSGEAFAAPADSPIRISCVLANDENYVGMPLPVEVVVSNSSDRAVVISSKSGRPYPVVFKSENGTERKKPPRIGGGMSPGIIFPPGSSQRFVYYPNRTIRFAHAGAARLNFDITVRYCYYDERESQRGDVEEKESGILEFELKQSDPLEVKKFLEKEMVRFKSGDRWIMADVAEAVCFIDNPAALEYMEAIVDSNNSFVQIMVLESLCYNYSDESDQILLAMLQPDGDDGVLQAVLGLLSDRDVEIGRQKIEDLLDSKKSRIRQHTLSYIEEKRLTKYLSLVRDMVKDNDEKVSELAVKVVKEFENSAPNI